MGGLRTITSKSIGHRATGGVRRSVSDKIGEFVSVKDFGAVGNGVADDTAAVQAAINASSKIHLPPGNYKITSTLLYHTVGYSTALTIIGSGMYTSGFTFAFNTGQPLLRLDGCSSQLYQFQNGGTLQDFYVVPAGGYAIDTQGAAIELIGVWNSSISRVRIDGVRGDGIRVPLRADLNVNPDAYATINLKVSHCRIINCSGLGVHGDGGVSFGSPTFEQCYIGINAKGGLLLGGHQPTIKGGSVFSNGKGAVGAAGIYFKRIHTNINGVSVRNVELDNNKLCQILLSGVANGEIVDNRMNSWETVFNDGVLSPPTHVKFATTISGAQNTRIEFKRNYHRSQYTGSATPASANFALTLYDLENSPNNAYIKISDANIPASDNTPTLTKYSGVHPNGRSTVEENFSIVIPSEITTAVWGRIVAAQNLATTSTTIVFDNLGRDLGNRFNTSTSTFTASYSGMYQVSLGLAMVSLTLGDRVRFYIEVNSGVQREITKRAGGIANETFEFVAVLFMAAGDTLKVKGDQNSGSPAAIRNGSIYNWLWIMGIN